MFEENAILEYDSFVEQKSLLQDILSHSLKPYTSLSLSEKQILMIHIIEDISELELILLPQETQKQDKVSFLLPSPIFESFQKLGIFMFPKAYASELSLTPEEREILILKTDILIERILQESIETEILYNKGDITQHEYGEIIEANLIELEELVILKNSLENDASVIDFEDIQRFNL